ncbi:MAG: D-alanyl-D-alanine carboxypeptidase [Ferruginibacter sp.]
MKNILPFLAAFTFLNSCSTGKQVAKLAKPLLHDSAVNTGHLGICMYEPATGKYWYNYNGSHYFIPASNTKLFTLYAGMKYLGDSLTGIRYKLNGNTIILQGSGDPTLLNEEYKSQPVVDFLKSVQKQIQLDHSNWKEDNWGNGWAWNDFGDNYCVERSALPVYANLYKFYIKDSLLQADPPYRKDARLAYNQSKYYNPPYPFLHLRNLPEKFSISRDNPVSDVIKIRESASKFSTTYLPKNINDFENLSYLKAAANNTKPGDEAAGSYHYFEKNIFTGKIYSQPSDSLFKPMMHRSDNFFAEQTLLMASNEYLGYMNDEAMIDTMLKTSLKDIPQKPKWVDGSGLSRYNLFTPQSFVYILNKMKDEFGLDRMKLILPTGGEGTISSYYKKEAGYIYAKTGTLSNNCALSGYLITKKGRLLIFSVLNNNYISGATPIRRAVERFLESIREKF